MKEMSPHITFSRIRSTMDISKIKKLVKQNGDRFIFVENGEPELVVMSFREYEKLAGGDSNTRMHSNYSNHSSEDSRHSSRPWNHSSAELASFESLGHETEFVSPAGFESSTNLPIRLEDIRLEDLPI